MSNDHKPQRKFMGAAGLPSIDLYGPEALKDDIDEINAMFNPNAEHKNGDAGGIGKDNLNFRFEDPNFSSGLGTPALEYLDNETTVAGQLEKIAGKLETLETYKEDAESAAETAVDAKDIAVDAAEDAVAAKDAAELAADTFTIDKDLVIANRAAEGKAVGDAIAAETAARQAQIANLESLVGSPLVITDPDDFDNASHTRVYVYTGTTTELYTSGDWYYWDGDGWNNGGTYTSEAVNTDDTISVSNMAADAKAVGNNLNNPPIDTTWSRGNINSSGNNSDSNSYIRSDYVDYIPGTKVDFDGVLLGTNETTNRVSFAYCYNATKTYLGRMQLFRNVLTDVISGTRYIRFTYGYSSSTGLIVDDVTSFSAGWRGYFLSKIWKTINYIKDNEAVTPQMFGAIADGIQDDTVAFQAALNSGHNVFVPVSNNEIYRITSTLTIPNTCKILYGTGQWRTATTYGGYILFDLTPLHDEGYTINNLRTYPLFDLDTAGSVMIQGLKFVCDKVFVETINKYKRVGYFVSAMNTNKVDYDFRLENVQVGGFYRGIRLCGRGCEVYNSQFNSMNYIATFTWDHDSNNNHPEGTGQRAIVFKNNRLHSIGSCFIKVNSGNAYGFTFINNTIDNGKGVLFQVEETARNWIIEGNLIQGIETKIPVMLFKGGILNSVIANNVLSADLGYWYNRTESPPAWIKSVGTIDGLNFSGNTVVNSHSSILYFGNIRNSVINGNVLIGPSLNNIEDYVIYDDENEITDDIIETLDVLYKESAIYFSGNASNVSIVGNVVKTENSNVSLVSKSANSEVSNVILNANLPNTFKS